MDNEMKYTDEPGGYKMQDGEIVATGDQRQKEKIGWEKYKEELKKQLMEKVKQGEKPVYEVDAEGNLVANPAAQAAEKAAKEAAGLEDKKAA